MSDTSKEIISILQDMSRKIQLGESTEEEAQDDAIGLIKQEVGYVE